MKKKILIIIFILIVVLLGVLGYKYKFSSKPSNTESVESNEPKEKRELLKNANWLTPNGEEGELEIYHYSNYDYYSSDYYPDSTDKPDKTYTFKCKNADCEILVVESDLKAAIIRDDKEIDVFDFINNKYAALNLEFEDFENVFTSYYDGEIIGLITSKNYGTTEDTDYKQSFYIIDKDEYLKDSNGNNYMFDYFSSGLARELSLGKIIAYNYDTETNIVDTSIINVKDGSVYKKFNEENAIFYTAIGNNGKVYFEKANQMQLDSIAIYTKDFKEISKEPKKYSAFSNGNLVLTTDNKTFKIYGENGEELKTSKEYKSIINIIEDYIIVLDKDDYIKLVNKDEKEITKITKKEKNYEILDRKSDYYYKDGEKCVAVVVEDTSVEEGTEGKGIEFYYNPKTKEISTVKTDSVIQGDEKPIIYLYPKEDDTKVKISFDDPDNLTVTYPKYNKQWEVTANKNGDLYDKEGNYYYALYFEEKNKTNVDFKTGFYVTKDNAIKFLEEKLSYIGLNKKERNEFIMYWLPVLENNKKSLVYFELTDSREKTNKLNITPKPDSMLRVAIHIKKVDKNPGIKNQELTKFKRKGFTVVEWGGVNYNK